MQRHVSRVPQGLATGPAGPLGECTLQSHAELLRVCSWDCCLRVVMAGEQQRRQQRCLHPRIMKKGLLSPVQMSQPGAHSSWVALRCALSTSWRRPRRLTVVFASAWDLHSHVRCYHLLCRSARLCRGASIAERESMAMSCLQQPGLRNGSGKLGEAESLLLAQLLAAQVRTRLF